MTWTHKVVPLSKLDAELTKMTGQFIHSIQWLPPVEGEAEVFIAAYKIEKKSFRSWKKKKAE